MFFITLSPEQLIFYHCLLFGTKTGTPHVLFTWRQCADFTLWIEIWGRISGGGAIGSFPSGPLPKLGCRLNVETNETMERQWEGERYVRLCGGDGPVGAGYTAHCGCVWPSSPSPGDNRLKAVTDKGRWQRCYSMLTLPIVPNCPQW